jgi:GTP cyclohydrolase II
MLSLIHVEEQIECVCMDLLGQGMCMLGWQLEKQCTHCRSSQGCRSGAHHGAEGAVGALGHVLFGQQLFVLSQLGLSC